MSTGNAKRGRDTPLVRRRSNKIGLSEGHAKEWEQRDLKTAKSESTGDTCRARPGKTKRHRTAQRATRREEANDRTAARRV